MTARRGFDQETYLNMAVKNEEYEVARFILSQPGGVTSIGIADRRGSNCVMHAAKQGNLPLVRSLLEAIPDVVARGGVATAKNTSEDCPMFCAVLSGNVELCEYLYSEAGARAEGKCREARAAHAGPAEAPGSQA